MTTKEIDKQFSFKDEADNQFSCNDGRITLQLKSEDRTRKIGEIVVIKGLLIYKKREDEAQVHRKTNSWSVPVHIYERINGIWFYTDLYNYKILKAKADKNKKFLHFKKVGNEKKVYIPLQLWSTKPI